MRNQPIVQRGLRLASSFFLWLVALGTTATLGQNPSPYSTPPLPLPFQDALADGRACPDCPSMILLQPASFVMGAMPGVGLNNERTDKNHPIPVEIPKPFAMSIQEVTRSEFAAFIAANPQQETPGPCAGLFDGVFEKRDNADWKSPGFQQTEDHPVVCVSWHQAKAYTEWLSRITGQTYRLPTEAEWEFAARAGSAGKYWWGEHMAAGKANCLGDQCGERFTNTAPAKALEPNPFGLFNMAGNVWEWTEDCYVADIYAKKPSHFPAATTGPEDCKRVIRGGSWSDNAWVLRSSFRESWKPGVRLNDLGFRVVRTSANLPI